VTDAERRQPRRRPRQRLAVVLLLTGPAADEVDGIRRALGATEISRLRPHVTVAAPANVGEDEVAAAVELVGKAAAVCAPLRFRVGPPATFLPVNPVLYLEVGGEDAHLAALERLAADLAEGPLAPPASRPQRPFVPHVTLSQHMAPERIEPAMAMLASYSAEVTIEEATLVRFDEGERRWLAVAASRLGAPAVVGRGGREVTLTAGSMLSPLEAAWAQAAWDSYRSQQYGPDVLPDSPFVIVARVGGEIVGVAEGTVVGATCRLARLVVAAADRSAGVGTQLLNAVESQARSAGCRAIRLETLAGGRAQSFYEGRGYSATAPLPRWRNDRDFVVMERAL
jgi:2'-5' RNA ligase